MKKSWSSLIQSKISVLKQRLFIFIVHIICNLVVNVAELHLHAFFSVVNLRNLTYKPKLFYFGFVYFSVYFTLSFSSGLFLFPESSCDLRDFISALSALTFKASKFEFCKQDESARIGRLHALLQLNMLQRQLVSIQTWTFCLDYGNNL